MTSVGIISQNHRSVSGSDGAQGAPPGHDKLRGPQWLQWKLATYVLQEPGPDAENAALWLKGPEEAGYRVWERIRPVPRSQVTIDTNILAVRTTSLRLRERIQGPVGRLLQRFRSKSGGTWVLPNGRRTEVVKQEAGRGEGQADVLLVWSEGERISLDEGWLVNRWPESTRRLRLGEI